MDSIRNGNCCPQKPDETSNECEETLKRFSSISSLYGYLKINFKKSHFLLYRNLSYFQPERLSIKSDANRSINRLNEFIPMVTDSELSKKKEIDEICEQLMRMRVPRVRALSESNSLSVARDASWSLVFVGFYDSFHESQWETIHASADIYVIHHWKNRRKFQSGKKTTKFLSNILISCNNKSSEQEEKFQKRHEFSQKMLFDDTNHLRIVSSYLLFKLRVLERRTGDYSKVDIQTPASQNNGLYAVHYELKIPFYKFHSTENDMKFYLSPGEYEMRLEVSLDQPTESISDLSSSDMLIDHMLDSQERVWVSEVSPTGSIAKEYDKWPRIVFKLESSNPQTKSDNNTSENRPHVLNGCTEKYNHDFLSASKKPKKAKLDVNVIYKFYHNDQILQWTRCQSVKCPWCNFICERNNTKLSFLCLIKHLQTFHARFSFKYGVVPAKSISTIVLEVRLNECYDGSIEIGLRSGFEKRSVEKPERKLPFTHIIYCSQMCKINPMVKNPSIDLRPLVWGHNRKYYYSTTGIVKSIGDLDVDSETEDNLDWLQHMYYKRIEEFTDVNPGEKRIMQLWNSHLLDHRYNGDFMVPILTRSFIIQKGVEIKEENLRNNLLLHLVNLVEFGVLNQKQLLEVVGLLDQM